MREAQRNDAGRPAACSRHACHTASDATCTAVTFRTGTGTDTAGHHAAGDADAAGKYAVRHEFAAALICACAQAGE